MSCFAHNFTVSPCDWIHIYRRIKQYIDDKDRIEAKQSQYKKLTIRRGSITLRKVQGEYLVLRGTKLSKVGGAFLNTLNDLSIPPILFHLHCNPFSPSPTFILQLRGDQDCVDKFEKEKLGDVEQASSRLHQRARRIK